MQSIASHWSSSLLSHVSHCCSLILLNLVLGVTLLLNLLSPCCFTCHISTYCNGFVSSSVFYCFSQGWLFVVPNGPRQLSWVALHDPSFLIAAHLGGFFVFGFCCCVFCCGCCQFRCPSITHGVTFCHFRCFTAAQSVTVNRPRCLT